MNDQTGARFPDEGRQVGRGSVGVQRVRRDHGGGRRHVHQAGPPQSIGQDHRRHRAERFQRVGAGPVHEPDHGHTLGVDPRTGPGGLPGSGCHAGGQEDPSGRKQPAHRPVPDASRTWHRSRAGFVREDRSLDRNRCFGPRGRRACLALEARDQCARLVERFEIVLFQ